MVVIRNLETRMASITIKDVPPEVHERLRQRARTNRRSLQQEILACLEEAVLPTRPDAGEIIEEARVLGRRFGIRVDHRTTDRYKREGRP
jgi:plasmid stability protein